MNLWMTTLATLGAAAFARLAGGNVSAKDTSGTSPREAVDAVDALFAAKAGHDMGASRRLILPGARFVMVLPDCRVRIEPDSGYLETLGKRKEAFRARIWAAQVAGQGNLTRVWVPYDFRRDGKLSPCGIDSFSLVRGSHGWRIVGVSYIVQKLGCASGPLGKVKWLAFHAGASPRAGALFDKAGSSGYLCGFCKRGAA